MKSIFKIIFSLIILVTYSCGEEPVPLPPPIQPSDLVGTTVSGTEILLEWKDNSDDEDGFVISWSGSSQGIGYGGSDTVGVDVTSYLSTGLTHLVYYTYKVHAYNADYPDSFGESSNEIRVQTFGVPLVQISLLPECVGSTSMNSSHYLSNSNGQPIIEHGIIWSTEYSDENELDISFETKSEEGPDWPDDTYSFYLIEGLEPNTIYYLRGYAITSVGVGYTTHSAVRTYPSGSGSCD